MDISLLEDLFNEIMIWYGTLTESVTPPFGFWGQQQTGGRIYGQA